LLVVLYYKCNSLLIVSAVLYYKCCTLLQVLYFTTSATLYSLLVVLILMSFVVSFAACKKWRIHN